jgi:recombination protein RecA
VAAFIDAEHALDPSWAKRLGVNLDDLLVSQPDTGEQALEICELLVRSNAVDVIVIDSVAALIPKAEIEGEMGDSHVGLQARLMSQAMRKLTGAIAKSQLHGDLHQPDPREDRRDVRLPETTPGGRALKFYARSASTSAAPARSRRARPSATACGPAWSRTRSRRRSAMPSSTSCSTRASALRATCSTWPSLANVVEKSGAWFSYGEVRLGQGRENAKQFLPCPARPPGISFLPPCGRGGIGRRARFRS